MLIIINNNTPNTINDSPIYVLVTDVEYTGKHLLDDS